MQRQGKVSPKEAEAYYSETEDSGRKLYASFVDGAWPVAFSDDTYGSYDAIICDDEGWALVEIKKRGYKSDAFDSWMLEKTKLQRLVKDRDELFPEGTGIVYVNIYADGVIRCWDIDEVLHKLEEREGTFSNLGSADAWHKKDKRHFGLDPRDAYLEVEWDVVND